MRDDAKRGWCDPALLEAFVDVLPRGTSEICGMMPRHASGPLVDAAARWPRTRAAAEDQAAAAGVRKQATAVESRRRRHPRRRPARRRAWLSATPITDFVQKEPIEGAAPTDRDGGPLRLRRRRAVRRRADVQRRTAAIQAPLGRRDDGDAGRAPPDLARHAISIAGPPTTFGVTASGVRLDRYHADRRRGQRRRRLQSGVGGARPSIDADGWTAELWIPFSQLRFNRARRAGLGAQRASGSARRSTKRTTGCWFRAPSARGRRASATCSGIAGIRPTPPARAAAVRGGASTVRANRDRAQSVRRRHEPRGPRRRRRQDGHRLEPDARRDGEPGLRAGRGRSRGSQPRRRSRRSSPRSGRSSLEGAQLLNVNHPNFFYSRRIGARPRGAGRPATSSTIPAPARSSPRPS